MFWIAYVHIFSPVVVCFKVIVTEYFVQQILDENVDDDFFLRVDTEDFEIGWRIVTLLIFTNV